ncbi:MAG: monofunctional biosynthetic peptidoglycan transglycosylase [Myxococcales bacterium]|nr:monofunctional biosynthetic peptidoglycan transglycosylase [Myxococcales bacterium]
MSELGTQSPAAASKGNAAEHRQDSGAKSAQLHGNWRRRLKRTVVALVAMVLVGPPLQCAVLNWVDPPVTGTMLQRTWQHWDTTGDWTLPAYTWVDLEDMPRSVPTAAMSSEDRSFLSHDGFDWVAIRRAWHRYQTKPTARLVGGSTISQQVARNAFLAQNRSWLRKGLEAWYTIWLEALVSKRRILEVYVNIAEMGPMVFGVGAASQHWFAKPCHNLTLVQSATMIALLPSPRHWTPQLPHVQRRAKWIVRSPVTLPKRLAIAE